MPITLCKKTFDIILNNAIMKFNNWKSEKYIYLYGIHSLNSKRTETTGVTA